MIDAPTIPLIGITTYRQDAQWRGGEDSIADVLPAEYARAIEAAGGAAVLLPPVDSVQRAAVIAARLDGIVIAGGADVNPARYGEEPDRHVTTWYDDRDESELIYIAQADERGLPVLGVCRGMQLLAVSRGGKLVQHLPDVTGTEVHTGGEHTGNANGFSSVTVHVEPGHKLSDLAPEKLTVACYHHQSVKSHPGFVGTAFSADGVLHAMEAEGERFVVGVQWHPEVMMQQSLFRGFIEAARVPAAVSAF